jgi:hypothetical protein
MGEFGWGTAMSTMQRLLIRVAIALITAVQVPAVMGAVAGSASALQASYARLGPELESSPFGKPLVVTSKQASDRLEGNIHAVLGEPFERVRKGLGTVNGWCSLLILHPNITDCRLGNGNEITVYVSKNAVPVVFTYAAQSAASDYLHVRLHADEGPAGTSDFNIDVEAAPVDAQRTMLHLAYSHAFGVQARLAMRAYLSTFGRGKVGFTVVDHTPEGKPVYVGDVRGALERNAMRYYICVEAYLESLAVPPAEQIDHRLKTYSTYTERYPLQLREEEGYLDAKRKMARNVS